MDKETATKSESSVPSADSLTLDWLWRKVPLKYWAFLTTLLVSCFIAGIYAGQIGWIKDLTGMNRSSHQSSVKSFPAPKPNQEVPKDPRIHIQQSSKGDRSQNIVTKGNVEIQFGSEKPEK